MKRLVFFAIIFLLCSLKSLGQWYGDTLPGPPSWISGEINGYEYVDLGLPSRTLWATINVGAETYTDIGLYFGWGEVEQRDYYDWDTYPYFNELKYNDDGYLYYDCIDIGKDICGTEYDAARVHWGSAWRLPNYDEITELRRNCWYKIREENGVLGIRLFGPNTNSIFFPVTSALVLDGIDPYSMHCGFYWGGTEFNDGGSVPEDESDAICFDFDTSGMNAWAHNKAVGRCIRPVIKKSELASINSIQTDNDVFIRLKNDNIVISSKLPPTVFELWSIDGKQILSIPYPDKKIPTTNINAGIYIAKIVCNSHIATTQKLIIK